MVAFTEEHMSNNDWVQEYITQLQEEYKLSRLQLIEYSAKMKVLEAALTTALDEIERRKKLDETIRVSELH
jgi:uncharacterized alpha/beta hydrolase family protein